MPEAQPKFPISQELYEMKLKSNNDKAALARIKSEIGQLSDEKNAFELGLV